MASFYASLYREDAPPRAQVLGTGESAFISLRLDNTLSVYLSGHGAECAQHARELARLLTDAAKEIEEQLPQPETAHVV